MSYMLFHFVSTADTAPGGRLGDISRLRGRHGHAVRQHREQKPTARAPRENHRDDLRVSTDADIAKEI